jgi:N-acetylneuraminic acid mutarotase
LPRLCFEQLPPAPNPHGLAAPFAGVTGGALLVAGGANFPDRKPWEGGVKVWHDQVLALDHPGGTWKAAGRLPRPLAYGVSVTWRDAVFCFGGSDAQHHYADGFSLTKRGGRLNLGALPPLPAPCANMAWAVAGSTLCVSGGIVTPEATECLRAFWTLDLNNPARGWNALEPCPGPARMLATAGAVSGDFLLFSGTGLSAGPDGKARREYLRDAWRYSPGRGWSRLADLPRPAVAAPSPAPLLAGRLLVLSGDDGSRVGFQPLSEHPGFARDALAYEPEADRWTSAGAVPFSRATVPVTFWRGRFVMPNGESRPGVRSPEVWTFSTRP